MDEARVQLACIAWVDGSSPLCASAAIEPAVELEMKRWRAELAPLCQSHALASGTNIGDCIVEADNVLLQLLGCLYESWRPWHMEGRWPEASGDAKPPRWLWRHRNVALVFLSGVDQTDYFQIDKDSLAACADRYLAVRWLRHPRLDWLLVDAMMAQEIVSFGEQMKSQIWVNASLYDLSASDAYERTKGNLSALEAIRTKSRAKVILLKLWWFTVAPILLVIVLIYSNVSGAVVTGLWWALAIYGIGYLLNLASMPLLYGYRRWLSRGKVRNPRVFVARLHKAMSASYEMLDTQAISPKAVQESLAESAALGAAWPNPIRPLMDRVLDLDRSVWTPHAPFTKPMTVNEVW